MLAQVFNIQFPSDCTNCQMVRVSLFALTAAVVHGDCSLEGSTDYEGYDLVEGSVASSSPEECCTACQDNSHLGCRFWTFAPQYATCYLKTSDAGRRHGGDPGVPDAVKSYTSGSIPA